MKKLISTALLLSGLASTSYAMPPNPGACPTAANIKAAGLGFADKASSGYIVMNINNYQTPQQWVFGITDIQANSKSEAMGIGYQALSTLNGLPQPTALASENVWACLYNTAQGYYGVAFTPVPSTALFSSVQQQLAK